MSYCDECSLSKNNLLNLQLVKFLCADNVFEINKLILRFTCSEKFRSFYSRCGQQGPGNVEVRSHQVVVVNSSRVHCGTAADQWKTLPAKHPLTLYTDRGLMTALQMLQHQHINHASTIFTLNTTSNYLSFYQIEFSAQTYLKSEDKIK